MFTNKGKYRQNSCGDLCDIVFQSVLLVWVMVFEPGHDKTNKVTVCPAKTQISLGIRPVWSVFAVSMKKAWVLCYPLSAQPRLIRLGECPGWPESSLGAQSLCWFCHVTAHLLLYYWFELDYCIQISRSVLIGMVGEEISKPFLDQKSTSTYRSEQTV